MRLQKGTVLIGVIATVVALAVATLGGPVSLVTVAVAAGVAAAAIWQLWQDHLLRLARRANLETARRTYELPGPALEGGVARFLRPEEEVVSFWPRRELEDLVDWVASERHVSARLVIGEGGSGKTRLARELASRVQTFGFRSWWVPPRAGPGAPWGESKSAGPALVIVDYAESQPELRELLANATGQPFGPPVRVLMLARSAGEWWQQLIDSSAFELRSLLYGFAPVTLGPVTDTSGQPAVFGQAVAAFAELLEVQRPDPEFTLTDPDAVVLVVHAAALLAVLDYIGTPAAQPAGGDSPGSAGRGRPQHGSREVLAALLSHEAAYWEQSQAARGLSLGPEVTRRVVASGCLIGADDEGGAVALLAAIPDLGGPASRGKVARWLHDLYPMFRVAPDPPEWIGLLQPDLLIEHLVAEVLTHHAALVPALFAGLSEQHAVRALTILARAAVRTTAVETLIGTALESDLPNLVLPAMTVAVANAAVGALLNSAIAARELPADVLKRIAEAVPYPSLALADMAGVVFGRLAEQAANEAERANWLHGLSGWLTELGRREDALAAIDEAVLIRRELAATDRGALPDLANSLNSQSNCLTSLGRREDALVAIEDAVTIRRQLAAADPDALPQLADSLNNLAGSLADLGRMGDALAAMDEAVASYRAVPATRFEAILPHLAAVLSNQSVVLGDLGQREEALAAISEAVAIRRGLATSRPDAFRAGLAASLNNRSLRLSDLGRPADALAASTEAVAIYRDLAAGHLDAYQPYLATALDTQSSPLASLGKSEAALAAIDEAVAIRRDLAVTHPDAFLHDLAESLDNQSRRLADVGRLEDALAASAESVTKYRELASTRREAFRPRLARSLHNQSLALAELGDRDNALTTIDEAVSIRRDLAATSPQAFREDLANSLNHMADVLDSLGRRDEANGARQEAARPGT